MYFGRKRESDRAGITLRNAECESRKMMEEGTDKTRVERSKSRRVQWREEEHRLNTGKAEEKNTKKLNERKPNREEEAGNDMECEKVEEPVGTRKEEEQHARKRNDCDGEELENKRTCRGKVERDGDETETDMNDESDKGGLGMFSSSESDSESSSPSSSESNNDELEEEGNMGNHMPSTVGELMRQNEMELSAIDRRIMRSVLLGVNITEVFSPKRVARTCMMFGMSPGEPMDLTTGWGFTKVEDRDRSIRTAIRDKPRLIIGSPPCATMSS